MSSAERKKRWLLRQEKHLAVFPLVVDHIALADELVLKGWLDANFADDRKRVLAAFEAAHMRIEILPAGNAFQSAAAGVCTVTGESEERAA